LAEQRAGDWSLEPDPKTAMRILDMVRSLLPEVLICLQFEHVAVEAGTNHCGIETERAANGALVVHNPRAMYR